MIIIKGDRFIRDGEKLYIVGAASNQFYKMMVKTVGPHQLLGRIIEKGNNDLSKLEEFNTNLGVELILISPDQNSFTRLCIIRNLVKKSTSISVLLPLPLSIIACFFAFIYKKPFVVESVGDSFASLWYHGGLKYKLLAWPVDFVVKIEHRLAKHIIYVSKNFLQRKYPSKARQIGCSDTILAFPQDEVLRRRLEHVRKHEGTFVLGLIGATHVLYRGHDTLIKAASVLREKGYDVRVSFLGGGNADDKRKTLARRLLMEGRVEFCGHVQHSQVLSWIDNIDVLVMPTLQETLGRAVIEAMSRACPVIGTCETALCEQIGSDCIVHARNVGEIADAIEKIISNKDYAEACAYENFYRSRKYVSDYTYALRKQFYDEFYRLEGIK